jgi:hypothetical protein
MKDNTEERKRGKAGAGLILCGSFSPSVFFFFVPFVLFVVMIKT